MVFVIYRVLVVQLVISNHCANKSLLSSAIAIYCQWFLVIAADRVVHITVDLSHADAYDELFPPSLFSEPEARPPDDVVLLPEDLTPRHEGNVNIVDEAFEDVEEINPFVGKTQVSAVMCVCNVMQKFGNASELKN